jgi:long-chain fatty acid transport protein
MNMQKLILTSFLLVAELFIFQAVAFSSGFYNGAQSAKAMSMGNAFVAQADDPTALYFNPAGIVQLESTQVAVGASIVEGNISFKSDGNNSFASKAGTTDIRHHTFFVPYGYITHKFNDNVSIGLSMFSNFGLCSDWPDKWEGRFVQGGTLSRLTTYSINPVLALRPHQKVSLAFGPVIQYLDLKLKNRTLNPFSSNELDTEFTGSNWGLGYNFGLLIWITENVKFGCSYRSEILQSISDGRLNFTPQEATPIPGVNFYDTGFTASIKTPAIVMFGLAWTHGPLTVEFDAQWTEWSSFEQLAANFNAPVGGQFGLTVPKNWRDAWEYHFGVQYALNKYINLRAGFIYDMGAVPASTLEPLVPFGDRLFYNAGLGIKYQKFTVDTSYTYMDGKNSTWNNAAGDPSSGGALLGFKRVTGKFEGIGTHLVLLTMSYKF